MFEKLENRRMFAVSDPINGVVTITGTEQADEIRVRIDSNGRLEIQDNFNFRRDAGLEYWDGEPG